VKAWQNWTGDETCAPEFTMPRSVDDVVAAVRRSAGAGRNVRLVGAGHSFGDVVCTDGTLMTLDGLRGLLDVDTAAGQVRVAAGTRLNELNRLLDEHGLALANLGDIDAQSVAGAIANGTHGTGRMLGNLAILVRSLRVWFRHAKAGELCERVDVLHLVENESIVATVPTYRGERRAIL
jgi:FAD/FMN-containing dehydrogenase